MVTFLPAEQLPKKVTYGRAAAKLLLALHAMHALKIDIL